MTREEAIAYIREWLKDEFALNGGDREVLNMAIEALQADAEQGEWDCTIVDGSDGSHWYEYECSHCGEVVLRPYNYCHNCGARMVKGGDSK